MDGSSYKDDHLKNKVHEMDGSSYEDDHLKSKTDGFKISPKSGRIILQGWPLEVQIGRI